MPRKPKPRTTLTPELQLISWALRDDPLIHKYRDLHYRLVIDQLQATGQRIQSGEKTKPLSRDRRKRLMKEHTKLLGEICGKYRLTSFSGGDPYSVRKDEWLSTLVPRKGDLPITISTNWETSYSSRVELRIIPPDAKNSSSKKGTIYQLPRLADRPLGNTPEVTLRIDFSQIGTKDISRLGDDVKRVARQCLKELPEDLRKASSTWQQNIERDYRRYRQHVQQGVSFRLIALWEKTKMTQNRRNVGFVVPNESSVRETVDRVHRLLLGFPYQARRNRSKLAESRLETAVKRFDCPDHGRGCPDSCRYAQNFIKNELA